MKVYLAGPMAGLSAVDVKARYQWWRDNLPQFDLFIPLNSKEIPDDGGTMHPRGYPHHPAATAKALFQRDRWMVQCSDILLADLSAVVSTVSIGTVMEIAWASIEGKHVVLVLPEGRKQYDHAFIDQAAHVVFPTAEEAAQYLQALQAGDL